MVVIEEFVYGREVDDEGFLCDVMKASDGNVYRIRMKENQANGWNICDDITDEIE